MAASRPSRQRLLGAICLAVLSTSLVAADNVAGTDDGAHDHATHEHGSCNDLDRIELPDGRALCSHGADANPADGSGGSAGTEMPYAGVPGQPLPTVAPSATTTAAPDLASRCCP